MARLKSPDMPVFEIIVNLVLTGWINKAEAGKCYISLVFISSNPFSRGMAHIISKDPTTYPALDANYFDHQIDLDIMAEAFKFGRDLANHEPFKKVVAREANPGLNIETETDIISMYDPLLLRDDYASTGPNRTGEEITWLANVRLYLEGPPRQL
ncbi:GMC oxidoreductase [Sphaerobolus stellatus SS14]|uniref:GMC oxidoreductase n=1 Tax=Sphaerobolus stellatus (strain SS14) TaxID=990650 RepID=A0A0C9TPB0_SPHS4|nr:GMC oxidoreductase [Sphaerobolus stellatus SS14]